MSSIDVSSDSCKRALMGDVSLILFGVEARTMDELIAVFDAAGLNRLLPEI